MKLDLQPDLKELHRLFEKAEKEMLKLEESLRRRYQLIADAQNAELQVPPHSHSRSHWGGRNPGVEESHSQQTEPDPEVASESAATEPCPEFVSPTAVYEMMKAGRRLLVLDASGGERGQVDTAGLPQLTHPQTVPIPPESIREGFSASSPVSTLLAGDSVRWRTIGSMVAAALPAGRERTAFGKRADFHAIILADADGPDGGLSSALRNLRTAITVYARGDWRKDQPIQVSSTPSPSRLPLLLDLDWRPRIWQVLTGGLEAWRRCYPTLFINKLDADSAFKDVSNGLPGPLPSLFLSLRPYQLATSIL